MIRKQKRGGAEIPSASMADIAFLMLIFFLVTTTFDVDTGIGLVLPPHIEEAELVKIKKENLANVLVNKEGQVLLDGDLVVISQIKEILKSKIRENDKLIISVKTDRETSYEIYIAVMDELKENYYELREEFSRQKFGLGLTQLTKVQLREVREAVPQRISLAEPEKTY